MGRSFPEQTRSKPLIRQPHPEPAKRPNRAHGVADVPTPLLLLSLSVHYLPPQPVFQESLREWALLELMIMFWPSPKLKAYANQLDTIVDSESPNFGGKPQTVEKCL